MIGTFVGIAEEVHTFRKVLSWMQKKDIHEWKVAKETDPNGVEMEVATLEKRGLITKRYGEQLECVRCGFMTVLPRDKTTVECAK